MKSQKRSALKGHKFMSALADCVLKYLSAKAVQSGRQGRFIPGFRLLYRDSAHMITVGGFLPERSATASFKEMVDSDTWCGFEDALIEAQPLTSPRGPSSLPVAPIGHRSLARICRNSRVRLGRQTTRLFWPPLPQVSDLCPNIVTGHRTTIDPPLLIYFVGPGGFSLGACSAGFKVVVAADVDHDLTSSFNQKLSKREPHQHRPIEGII